MREKSCACVAQEATEQDGNDLNTEQVGKPSHAEKGSAAVKVTEPTKASDAYVATAKLSNES